MQMPRSLIMGMVQNKCILMIAVTSEKKYLSVRNLPPVLTRGPFIDVQSFQIRPIQSIYM